MADFQSAFKATTERTTSSPAGLHYTIWKTVAREDDLSSWLSIMMSLPFRFGFVNARWKQIVDAMIEKKRGVQKFINSASSASLRQISTLPSRFSSHAN